MHKKKNLKKKNFFFILQVTEDRSRIRTGGASRSGSISQRHGSADPDPHKNVRDPQHWLQYKENLSVILIIAQSLPRVPGRESNPASIVPCGRHDNWTWDLGTLRSSNLATVRHTKSSPFYRGYSILPFYSYRKAIYRFGAKSRVVCHFC